MSENHAKNIKMIKAWRAELDSHGKKDAVWRVTEQSKEK